MSNNIKAILFDDEHVVGTYHSVEDAYAAAAILVADPDENTFWEDVSVSIVFPHSLGERESYNVVTAETHDGWDVAVGLVDADEAVNIAIDDWRRSPFGSSRWESFSVEVWRADDDEDAFVPDGEYVTTIVDLTKRETIPFRYIFRAQIERLGKSQRAVAEMLHLPLRTVENWLAGINEPDEFKANAVVEKMAEYIWEEA